MSGDVAIRVEGLGKKYRLGLTHSGSIREAVSGLTGRLRRGGRRKKAVEADAYDPARLDDGGKSFWALKDVSFEVPRGEVLGVIGRNGAGKSTLLKILSRITHPTEGHAELHGRVGSLLEVGTGFHPELTGRENVFMNGTILGMTRREVAVKFDEIVAFSGVEKFIDTPVKRYSSGMRVRLGFAVAAHLEPEILIVDEVLAVGDAEFQRKCLGKMKRISEEGRTVLFVSHSMAAIENLTERCVVVEDARVAFDGPTNRAIERYSRRSTTGCEKPVADRNDRSGTGAGKLVKATLTGSSRAVKMGDDWCVLLCFTLNEPLTSPHVGLIVENERGTRVARIQSSETYGSLGSAKDALSLFITVRSPNLCPGTYSMSVVLSDARKTILDRVENAMEIQVAPSDVYATGRAPGRDGSPCFFYADWSAGDEASRPQILSSASSTSPREQEGDLPYGAARVNTGPESVKTGCPLP